LGRDEELPRRRQCGRRGSNRRRPLQELSRQRAKHPRQAAERLGNFPSADKVKCIESIEWFEPTYTELAACLEMYRDARTGVAKEPVKPPPKKP